MRTRAFWANVAASGSLLITFAVLQVIDRRIGVGALALFALLNAIAAILTKTRRWPVRYRRGQKYRGDARKVLASAGEGPVKCDSAPVSTPGT
jgi:hypothetical protein